MNARAGGRSEQFPGIICKLADKYVDSLEKVDGQPRNLNFLVYAKSPQAGS